MPNTYLFANQASSSDCWLILKKMVNSVLLRVI